MSTQRSDETLRRLDEYLRKLGYGTALVDAHDWLDDTWNGLLVWEIPAGARKGVVIRCVRGEFRFENGVVLAADDDLAGAHEALRKLFDDARPQPQPPA